ncbi:hypothetical protein JST97_00075 [bacterium]|nr:hypothetical protein [bacterium]
MDLRVQKTGLTGPLSGPVRKAGGQLGDPVASPMLGQDQVLLGLPGGAPLDHFPSAQPQPVEFKPQVPSTDTASWVYPSVLPEFSSAEAKEMGQSLELSLARKLAEVQARSVVPPPANHPGVELHNHLLGIVDTRYFIDKCADGDAVLLMKRLQKMFQQSPLMRQEAPEVAKILAGSALQIPSLSQSAARHQLERVLTASPCTPFDDVYTPRDELIKQHLELTPDQLDAILAASTTSAVDDRARLTPEQCRHLRQTLGSQLSHANARQLVEAGLTPRQAVHLTGRMIDRRYETFVEDSQRALHQDNIHYSEQSISLNKLVSRLPESMMKRVDQRLKADGIESDLRYLAMVGTTNLCDGFLLQLNPKTGLPTVFEQEGLNISRPQFERLVGYFSGLGATREQAIKAIANSDPHLLETLGLNPEQAIIVSGGLPPQLKIGLEKAVRRGDVLGIDVASPEKEPFTARGMKNFDEMYDILKKAAQERGRPLVLRPHVGEGYPEMPEGSHGFHRYKVAREGGGPKHYSLAAANLETLISHLENRGYSAAQAAKDGVIVRFGHATHLTQDQVQRIKELGIYAEANLGSNVQTGALQPNKAGDFFENHPLLSLMYHDVPTVLNTDAHGVMHTSLRQEYEQADRLIKMFTRNKISLAVNGKSVYYRDLSPEQQQRFNPQRLRQWASEYEQLVRAADLRDTARQA